LSRIIDVGDLLFWFLFSPTQAIHPPPLLTHPLPSVHHCPVCRARHQDGHRR
jgi:hypothetical protein